MRRMTLFCLVLVPSFLGGCNEYWWTRGQPPAVETILQRAELRLAESMKERAAIRPEISSVVQQIQRDLGESRRALIALQGEKQVGSEAERAAADSLVRVREGFLALEGKLAVTNRIPFNELSGQLRAFITALSSGERWNEEGVKAFELYSSRVLFFFAEELKLRPHQSA